VSDPAEQLLGAARASLAPTEGRLEVDGLERPVRVVRDQWGVPSILAENLDDLFFAQGFVTASERLFQMDLAIRASNGRLSELFGDLTVAEDRFARTVGWHRAGARIAAEFDEESTRIAGAFRRGSLAWLAAMPAPPVEYALLGAAPSLPDEANAWASCLVYLAWQLSGNWEEELIRAEIAERLGVDAVHTLYPGLRDEDPTVLAGKRAGEWRLGPRGRLDLLNGAPPPPPGRGSNNWVVAGSRSVSGAPLLANDPHLDPTQPGVWFEAHLRAPGYEARGVCLPFAPGVIIGRTAHHAWGFTNVTGDVQDLYVERLNEDATAALYQNGWEPLTVHREEIVVRGRPEPEILDVRETRHGPILSAYLVGEHDPKLVEGGFREQYALRWTGHEATIAPVHALHAARAATFEEFREGLRDLGCPGQNVVYADVDGHIGYQCTGRYPIRRSGDGTMPVPGWTDEHEWDGFVPFDELPWASDPEEGFLATANNRPVDGMYPHFLGADFGSPQRVRRIAEMLEGAERHTPEDFSRMQMDTVSLTALEMLPLLTGIDARNDGARRALDALRGWDGDVRADSSPAAVFQAWSVEIARAVLGPRLGGELFARYYAGRGVFHNQVLAALLAEPGSEWWGDDSRDEVLRASLDASLTRLETELGDDPAAWRWGALHRVVLAEPLARIPGMAEPFTAAVVELGGDEQTVCNAGFDAREGFPVSVIPSWRTVVDLGDPGNAGSVLPTGQSGNLCSPHWNDQTELWSAGGLRPAPLRPPEGDEIEGVLSLEPHGYHL
jgi:penicillin amidase